MLREVFSFATGPKGSPFLPSCIALLAALQIHHPMAAPFRVIGPGQPVVVAMGEDAVLPCHLSPPMSAESMEVRWLQPGFSSYVHLYRGGQDQDGQQMPAYRGRTKLVKDDLTDGSVSLRIRGVRPSDHGLYTCFVQSNDSSGDAVLELQVTGHYFPWAVALAVILPVVVLLGSFCLWRQHRVKVGRSQLYKDFMEMGDFSLAFSCGHTAEGKQNSGTSEPRSSWCGPAWRMPVKGFGSI